MQTRLYKSTLSLVLVATSLLIWTTPAAALRQTGLEESKEERDKLKTALRAPAGNFPGGRLLPPTAGQLVPLPAGLEEDLSFDRAWDKLQILLEVNGINSVGFWLSRPVFVLDQALFKFYHLDPDWPVTVTSMQGNPLPEPTLADLRAHLESAVRESPLQKVRFLIHRGSGLGRPSLYVLPAGLTRRPIEVSEALNPGDRLVAKGEELIMAVVDYQPRPNRPASVRAWSPMNLAPLMEMDMAYLAEKYDVIPAGVAPVAAAGLEEQEVDFGAWLARFDAEPAKNRRTITIRGRQVEAVRLPAGKIAVSQAVSDAFSEAAEGLTLVLGKDEKLRILAGDTGLGLAVMGPNTNRYEMLRYPLEGAPYKLMLVGKDPSPEDYSFSDGREAVKALLTVLSKDRAVGRLHLAILVGPAKDKKFWIRDLSPGGTYVPVYLLAALRKQLEREAPPIPAPQPPQPGAPTTAGLEESNLRKAIVAGSIFSFDFFENISSALIDAAIKAGATEFTMNPYSTGNYIQHLMTLTTPEGFNRARGLQLTLNGREPWLGFRQDLEAIAKEQPRVYKAIKAALEPSPDVTPETEQALAVEVIGSELAESRVVRQSIEDIARGTANGERAYWAISKYHLAEKIAKKLLPIYQATQGRTGYVSIEVDPRIERPEFARARAGANVQNLEGWMAQRMQTEAEDLSRIAENVLVKVPNTPAGLATVGAVNANFNVTLTFADEDAREAIAAYEHRPDPKHILRISPFVSRNAVYFEEFWADLLSVPDPEGGRLLDGHAATIANMFDVYQALGPYAEGAIWSSLGMKIDGDPGELYAKQVIGTGILNAPPETARDFNRAQFEVQKRFWLSATEGEGLTSILSDYFSDVHAGKVPSAVDKFPQLTGPRPEVSPWEQAGQAALRWRELINRPVTQARLQQFEARLAELEKKKGVKRQFTREALEIARARLATGQPLTERDLMRLVLKKEGEEKFITPFQGAIDLLDRTLTEIRAIEQARPLHEASRRLVEGWLALPAEQRPALQVDDQTFTFYERTAGPNDPRRNITLEQVRGFLETRPATVVQLFRRQPGPDLLYLLKLRTPDNQEFVRLQAEALQQELATLRESGLEEAVGEALAEVATQQQRLADAQRAGDTSLAATAELDLRRAEAGLSRVTSPAPARRRAPPEDQGPALVTWQAGLEEGKPASVMFISFDLAAGLPLIQHLKANVYVVAPTPEEYWWAWKLGIPVGRIIGLVGGMVQESDYERVQPGIGGLMWVDTSVPNWRDRVESLVRHEAEQGRTTVIFVYDADSLAAGLRALEVPELLITQVLQARTEAEDSLRQMP